MKFFTLLALIVASSASAGESFKLSGKIVDFDDHEGLLLVGCEKPDCEALKSIRLYSRIDLKEVRKGQRFANSIGSDVCAKVYRGSSTLGLRKNGDGAAFCFFEDRSGIEMNSLTDYLVKKKIVTGGQ